MLLYLIGLLFKLSILPKTPACRASTHIYMQDTYS